jgi:two-component system, OmpR family, phosphate regulon sensor histidine kinase PhoR
MSRASAGKAPARILVVEDERDIAALVAYHLTKEGYRVRTTESGQEALEAVAAEKPDLLVLDLMLPGFSGYEVLQELRRRPDLSDVPVVVLTARRDEADRVKGLELGADDYVTKPFSPRELVLRVGAVLRRAQSPAVAGGGRTLRAGEIVVDLNATRVEIAHEEVDLTPTEYRLLVTLLERRGPGSESPAAARDGVGHPCAHRDAHGGHARAAAALEAGGPRGPDRDGPRLRLPVPGPRGRMNSPLRTARLFAIVCLAAVTLSGAVVMQVVHSALRDSGVDAAATAAVQRSVLVALVALGVILFGVAVIAGRAYARSLNTLREAVLARARGDSAIAPQFAVGELSDLVSAMERLSAHVSSRETRIEREGAEVGVLLDAISEGILQLDSAGRVVRANPAARALLGLSQRAIGEPIANHIRQAGLRRLLERAVAGASIPAAEIALEDHRIIVSAHPLSAAGDRTGGSVVAFVDLTQVRRLESVRRDFVANVSHELKTPLTSIRGYVETLLADPDLPVELQRPFLEVVQKNAERLHHIVDDLLDLSRLESGGWRPELHDVNAVDVIQDVWSSCAERADSRRITFTVPAGTPVVRADPGGLRQVFANLLDNAVRYTPDGGRIEVRALETASPPPTAAFRRQTEEATARLVPASDTALPNGNGNSPSHAQDAPTKYIAFEVRDTGTGVPSDALPRIFERFYRVDPARSRAEGGTGLGLSIVKHLVESMGGDITAESELGKGTTIRFRLPAAV